MDITEYMDIPECMSKNSILFNYDTMIDKVLKNEKIVDKLTEIFNIIKKGKYCNVGVQQMLYKAFYDDINGDPRDPDDPFNQFSHEQKAEIYKKLEKVIIKDQSRPRSSQARYNPYATPDRSILKYPSKKGGKSKRLHPKRYDILRKHVIIKNAPKNEHILFIFNI